jgi:hypothetical protein
MQFKIKSVGYLKRLMKYITNNQTPWLESSSELYRPSDRSLAAKLVPTFADRGCHVVSVTDPYGRIIEFLDRLSVEFWHLFSVQSFNASYPLNSLKQPWTVCPSFGENRILSAALGAWCRPQKRTTMWKEWGSLWAQIVDWRWEWSVVS